MILYGLNVNFFGKYYHKWSEDIIGPTYLGICLESPVCGIKWYSMDYGFEIRN